MGRSFQVDVLEVCDPYEFNLTRESPRHIDPHRSLMSGLKKDLREVVQKQNRTHPPSFSRKTGGPKISVFDDSCTPKSQYKCSGGGGRPSVTAMAPQESTKHR